MVITKLVGYNNTAPIRKNKAYQSRLGVNVPLWLPGNSMTSTSFCGMLCRAERTKHHYTHCTTTKTEKSAMLATLGQLVVNHGHLELGI